MRRCKVLDAEMFGNVVRFHLGEESVTEWWGDDWNDTPYEHNAGSVYSSYTCGHVDVAFPADFVVREPSDGHWNSPWRKQDMLERKVPLVAVLPQTADYANWRYDAFDRVVAADAAWRVYMGDVIDVDDASSWLCDGAVSFGFVADDG